MKVTDLFENVVKVDFSKGRNKPAEDHDDWSHGRTQELSFTPVDRKAAINGEDEAESLTVHELAEFEEYMATAKKKGRVPGFDTMDDCIHFLLAEIELPNHITRSKAIVWFTKMSEEEREQARMLAHHADRMIQIFELLRTKLHGIQNTWYKRFNGKPPQGWDAIEGAIFLDTEFNYDITQLKNLKKAITILGQ